MVKFSALSVLFVFVLWLVSNGACISEFRDNLICFLKPFIFFIFFFFAFTKMVFRGKSWKVLMHHNWWHQWGDAVQYASLDNELSCSWIAIFVITLHSDSILLALESRNAVYMYINRNVVILVFCLKCLQLFLIMLWVKQIKLRLIWFDLLIFNWCKSININFQIYIDDLENNLRLVRYFADNESAFQDDNVPEHRARITENYKQENNIIVHRGQPFPDLNVCENVLLCIKNALQPIDGNINTQNELIIEICLQSPRELYS